MKKTIMAFLSLSLLLLLPSAMADTGPHPPYWMTVTLNITYNGAPVPDGTKVEAFCHPSYNSSSTVAAEFWCKDGVCTNKEVYGLTRCYGGELFFNISHPSFPRAYTTPAVKIGEGGSQPVFGIELRPDGSTNITEMQFQEGPDGNQTIIPKPPPGPTTCPLALILAALPLALAFCRR